MSTVSRRTKWHPTPPPPPSPKILYISCRRRTRRRKQTTKNNPLLLMNQNLESLFHQESPEMLKRRERVEEECKLLRMEREIGLKKNRVKMERASTLVSGRRKTVEGENRNAVLEEEVEEDNKSTHAKENNNCSGRCKAIVVRIVEQVRAETEQWSQMQKMLEQVRGEMAELQASRDYWERQAHNSDYEAQSLRHAVEEWKERALDLELKLSTVKQKMQTSKLDLRSQNVDIPLVPLGAQLVKERLALKKNYHKLDENKKTTPKKDLPPLSLAKQLAKEKRSFIRSLKENRRDEGSKQELSNSNGPLMDIGNSSALATQSHRAAFHYHSPESSRIRKVSESDFSFLCLSLDN